MIHVTRVSNKERERDLIYGGFHTHTPQHTHTHKKKQKNFQFQIIDSSAINICGYKYVSLHFIILWKCIKFVKLYFNYVSYYIQ